MVGCGMFASNIHVPNLKKNPRYNVYAVTDISESAAKGLAEKAGAEYWTTDVDELLSDKKVDVVFITTRHDSHAELTIKAAEAGKHVLCEKPMALNIEECRAIAECVRRNNIKYTVGYNRGLAPMITKAHDLLRPYDKKKLIYHRIQAPFPENHWTHNPAVGGGRFIGEGCHIFDLLCEIVQAPPISVYASGGIFLDPAIVKIPDSAIVTITFADGSIGTTIIASAGCPGFPKESTEIYCDYKTVYINDFKHMEYYGFEGQDRITCDFDSVDKGHALEIDLLADAILNNAESPNGLYKATRAALISYKVNESIEKGAPVSIREEEYRI